MKQFLLFCITGFIATLQAYAQNVTVSGYVLSHDNRGVFGAVISINNQPKTVTDATGRFAFNLTSENKVSLRVSCLGYTTYTQNVTATGNQTLQIKLTESQIDLSEISVSAQSQNTISGIDKVLRPVNNAQELLQLIPGLFVAQHAGGGKAEQIFIRGFDVDHGTDFNITVDGMPVNMVSHAHGQGYADFHFVIPEAISQLQVYKGPYNARFGDFSTAGTGAFFTHQALDKNLVKLEAGMFDTYRALGMFKLIDKEQPKLNAHQDAYIATEYVFTNAYFDAPQKFNRFNIFGKYSGQLTKATSMQFSGSTFYADWDASGQVPQRAVDQGIITRFGSIDPTEGGTTNRSNANLIFTTQTQNGTFRNQLYYVNYFFNLYSNFTFFLEDTINGDEIQQTDRRNIFGYLGTYSNEIKFGNQLVQQNIGIGIRNDITRIALKNSLKRELVDTITSGKVFQQNASAYYDATVTLNKLTVNAGLRLDVFNFNYDDDVDVMKSGDEIIARVSPKLNFNYQLNNKTNFYLNTGVGFHSNDARSVVLQHTENSVPRAFGIDIGSELKPLPNLLLHIALWGLYSESELVFVGDAGTIETGTSTQRLGIDFSLRYQLTKKLFADFDLNLCRPRLQNTPSGEDYVPLAPTLTSIGGLTYTTPKGFSGSLRYKHINSRPANEDNSVEAKGYLIFDAVANYKFNKTLTVGLSAENLLNSEWNQAQFDTESRLKGEAQPVSELHFTPGTPFFIKAILSVNF
ncbi:MAG: TonB-dependent receptor [Bacteroidia bacterium]|nr:TonB-dependent receptor [Bacteroidia bacterium]